MTESRVHSAAGITGWAQINGWRGKNSIEKRIEHDICGIENWSFGFDLKILFLTIWKGLLSKPKYHHKVIGCNSRLDTLQAAVLLVKLKYLDQWTDRRRENAKYYQQQFKDNGLAEFLGCSA